jgi:hypothetical protein
MCDVQVCSRHLPCKQNVNKKAFWTCLFPRPGKTRLNTYTVWYVGTQHHLVTKERSRTGSYSTTIFEAPSTRCGGIYHLYNGWTGLWVAGGKPTKTVGHRVDKGVQQWHLRLLDLSLTRLLIVLLRPTRDLQRWNLDCLFWVSNVRHVPPPVSVSQTSTQTPESPGMPTRWNLTTSRT